MSNSPPSPNSSSDGKDGSSDGSGSPPPSGSKSSSSPSPPSSNSDSGSKAPPPSSSSSDSGSSPPSPPKSPPPKDSSSPPPKSSPSPPPPPKSSSESPPPPSNKAPPPSVSTSSPSSDNSSPPPSPPKTDNLSPPPPDSHSNDSPSNSHSNDSPPDSQSNESPSNSQSNDSPPDSQSNESPSNSQSNDSPSPPSRESRPSRDTSRDAPSPEKSLPFVVDTPTDPSSTSRPRPARSDSPPSDRTSSLDPPSRNKDTSSSTPSSSKGSSGSSHSMTGLAIGLAVAGVVVLLVAFIIVFSRKKRKRSDGLATYYIPPTNYSGASEGYYYKPENPLQSSSRSDSYHASKPAIPVIGNMNGSQRGYHSGLLDPGGSKSSFTYEELIGITNGFSRENLLGEGGFGCVYKGCLPDGREVAVKELKAGSGQGEREFQAEVEIISRVHHRHLVSLVGYCIAQHHRLLVYEFVPNDTLENHLHGKASILDWPKRQKIAIGSARGLAYLHEDCHPRIIHRDIKSANILLDDSFEAQVADFGLAKLSNDTRTHVSTRVMGTFGYMAPEYASSGKLTDRSDVYSFGVVLLELITGRKAVDASQPLGDESLVEWARPVLVHAMETGDYSELVDPKLENNYARSEMFRMVEAAAACVRHSAPKRPRMVQVVRALDFDDDTDLSNGVKFGQSQVFDSNQYNADIQKFRNMAFGSSQYSGEYGYSGEQERRSAVNSGEFRSGQGLPRPPGQWNSQQLEPRGANHRVSGELAPPRPPSQQRPSEHYGPSEYQSSGGGGFAPSYRPRPGEYNSGEYRPRPGEYNSGEHRPRRPGEYSSGEYDSGNESETRAINRGNSGRSDAGSYRYNGRGIP